jgi:hypothetical protein
MEMQMYYSVVHPPDVPSVQPHIALNPATKTHLLFSRSNQAQSSLNTFTVILISIVSLKEQQNAIFRAYF